LEPISCAGCHGRPGEGSAGLRQHHTNAGVHVCKTCHEDADPALFTPAGEDVLPSYYEVMNDVFVNKPTDPCSQGGDEDYAGGPKGLDNDGDGRYDKAYSTVQDGLNRASVNLSRHPQFPASCPEKLGSSSGCVRPQTPARPLAATHSVRRPLGGIGMRASAIGPPRGPATAFVQQARVSFDPHFLPARIGILNTLDTFGHFFDPCQKQ
jgi:hypothetical protein